MAHTATVGGVKKKIAKGLANIDGTVTVKEITKGITLVGGTVQEILLGEGKSLTLIVTGEPSEPYGYVTVIRSFDPLEKISKVGTFEYGNGRDADGTYSLQFDVSSSGGMLGAYVYMNGEQVSYVGSRSYTFKTGAEVTVNFKKTSTTSGAFTYEGRHAYVTCDESYIAE